MKSSEILVEVELKRNNILKAFIKIKVQVHVNHSQINRSDLYDIFEISRVIEVQPFQVLGASYKLVFEVVSMVQIMKHLYQTILKK